MGGNRPIRVLVVAGDEKLARESESLLAQLGCFARSAVDSHGLGRALAEATPDVFLFHGPLAGYTPKRVIPMLREQAPRAVLLVADPDAAEGAALAEIFAGYALPMPLDRMTLQAALHEKIPPSRLLVRKTPRWRLYAPAVLGVAGENREAVVLNFSTGGAMLLATAEADVGALVGFRFEHAGAAYALAGRVRHAYASSPAEAGEFASLAGAEPRIFGLEFIPESQAAAQELCRKLAASPPVFPFSVFCVPGVPRGLAGVLEHYGISVAVATELPAEFDVPPTLLLADLASLSHEELHRLRRTAGKSILVGLASKPLTDPERGKFAASLPAVFVLPHQSDALAETIDRFFRPIHRKHPRVDASFDLVLELPGGRRAAGDGVNLSLAGCAALLDLPLPAGAQVTGTVAPAGARETFRFAGTIAWCVEDAGRHRVGVDFEVDAGARAAFHAYLAGALQKDLQRRWLKQLEHG